MKAISLQQPWATMVAIGAKSIETRSWYTSYRGPLAIHASKIMPTRNMDLAAGDWRISEALKSAGYATRTELKTHKTWNGEKWLPSGVVVATCWLQDVIEIPKEDSQVFHFSLNVKQLYVIVPPLEPELSFGNYSPGRYAWILVNVRKLDEPIAAKGRLGLWDWDGYEHKISGLRTEKIIIDDHLR